MTDTHELTLATLSADGARSATLLIRAAMPQRLLVWLPAMGMPARHYLAFAHLLAAGGTAVALHEWRGIGASDQRASRAHNWGYRELIHYDLPATLAAVAAATEGLPVFVGGHSLGGQLATLLAATQPQRFRGLAVVASGAPYWRRFPRAPLLYLAYAAAPLLARMVGYLPGRRLGFGGNEARGVTRDWARSGRTGVYTARGLPTDFEKSLAAMTLPAIGVRLTQDWMVPAQSVSWLFRHIPPAQCTRVDLSSDDLGGIPAGHFHWLKQPAAVVSALNRWWPA
jgi:predicted alpha/beta hydrolase